MYRATGLREHDSHHIIHFFLCDFCILPFCFIPSILPPVMFMPLEWGSLVMGQFVSPPFYTSLLPLAHLIFGLFSKIELYFKAVSPDLEPHSVQTNVIQLSSVKIKTDHVTPTI